MATIISFEEVLAATLEADQQAQEARESSKTDQHCTLSAFKRAEKARLAEEKQKQNSKRARRKQTRLRRT